MDTPRRFAAASLIEALEQEPRGFSFFAAMALIEARRPDASRLGWCDPVGNEAVRFVGNPALAFPSSEIDSLWREVDATGRVRYHVMVNLLGLCGQGSPLPTWYTEELVQSELDEHAVKDCLDLFQHRLLGLLRRCGTKYRYYLGYRPDGEDRVSQWLYALMGALHPTLRHGTTLDWQRLLAYTGVIAMRQHSAPMIAGLLSHYFGGLPVQVEQFVEERAAIPTGERAVLGCRHCELGSDLTIGAWVPDCGGRLRVHIGPLGFAGFRRFLPDGADRQALSDLLELLLADPLHWELALVLRAAEIPSFTLDAAGPCRLGWSSWLGSPGGDSEVCFVD